MHNTQTVISQFEGLAAQSKVWVYTIDRVLDQEEQDQINQSLMEFAQEWQSHGLHLIAKAQIVDERFIVLMVDESAQGASGCSIDSSVRFITTIGEKWNFNPFNRMLVGLKSEDKVQVYGLAEFKNLWKENQINADTLVIDTLVKTKSAFDTAWSIALKDSWHNKLVN